MEAARGNWQGGISSIDGPLDMGRRGRRELNTAHKAFSVRSQSCGLVDAVRSAEQSTRRASN